MIGLACSRREIYHFCLVLLCIRGQIPSTSHRGGLYLEGRCNRVFCITIFGGAYIWGGGGYFRNFTVYQIRHSVSSDIHTIKKWIEKNNEAQLSLMSLTLICLEIGCNTGSAVFIEPPKWTKLLFRKFQCKRLQSFMVISTRHSHMTQKFFSLFCKLNCYSSEFEK